VLHEARATMHGNLRLNQQLSGSEASKTNQPVQQC
jgi:hypothetical protein